MSCFRITLEFREIHTSNIWICETFLLKKKFLSYEKYKTGWFYQYWLSYQHNLVLCKSSQQSKRNMSNYEKNNIA